MKDLRPIVKQEFAEYGSVKVKLAQLLDDRGITRNRLHELADIKYDVVTRYYKGENMELVDLDILAKVCYVLDCDIGDLLEYQPPKE